MRLHLSLTERERCSHPQKPQSFRYDGEALRVDLCYFTHLAVIRITNFGIHYDELSEKQKN